jgi:hypothetical protein
MDHGRAGGAKYQGDSKEDHVWQKRQPHGQPLRLSFSTQLRIRINPKIAPFEFFSFSRWTQVYEEASEMLLRAPDQTWPLELAALELRLWEAIDPSLTVTVSVPVGGHHLLTKRVVVDLCRNNISVSAARARQSIAIVRIRAGVHRQYSFSAQFCPGHAG